MVGAGEDSHAIECHAPPSLWHSVYVNVTTHCVFYRGTVAGGGLKFKELCFVLLEHFLLYSCPQKEKKKKASVVSDFCPGCVFDASYIFPV